MALKFSIFIKFIKKLKMSTDWRLAIKHVELFISIRLGWNCDTEFFLVLKLVIDLLGEFSHENDVDLSVKEGELVVCGGGNVYSYFVHRDYKKRTQKIARIMCHLVGFLKNRYIVFIVVSDSTFIWIVSSCESSIQKVRRYVF